MELFIIQTNTEMEKYTIYELKRKGELLFQGAEEDSCFIKLQRIQSQSANWAMKHEGYTVTSKEVSEQEFWEVCKNDRYYHVSCILEEDLKPNKYWLKVRTEKEGYPAMAEFNGIRFESRHKGGKVYVMNAYLKIEK